MPEDNEAIVVNNDAVEETASTEATTEGNNSPTTEVESTDSTLDTETDGADENQTDETETEEKPKSRADERKEKLDSEIEELEQKLSPQEEIRQRVARRNELRAEVERMNAQAYQAAPVPTIDELVEQVNPDTGDYYTRLEADIEVMKQREQVREYNEQLRNYNEQVAEKLMTLEGETQAVFERFPQFDANRPESSEFKGLIKEAGEIINSGLEYDQTTQQMVGSTVSPYKLYNLVDMAYKAGAKSAETKGQKSVERMLSQADPSPTGQATTKSFANMTQAERRTYLRQKGHDI